MTKMAQIKKNDYILIFIAILFLILSTIVIFQPSFLKFWPKTKSPQIIGKAVLTIDFGNDTKRIFEGDIINNETFVSVLIQASKAGNFSYKLDEKSNLAAIENYTNDKTKSWQWYLNNKKVNGFIGEIIINSNDEILIKYE